MNHLRRRRLRFSRLIIPFTIVWLSVMLAMLTPVAGTPYRGLVLFCGGMGILGSGLYLIRRTSRQSAPPPPTSDL